MPRRAALLRYEACMNSPRIDRSENSCDTPAEIAILASVARKQNRTNFRSQTSVKSTVARSENKRNGSGSRNTNLFAFDANSSSTHPTLRSTIPITIIKKTGSVAFRLKIKLSITPIPRQSGIFHPEAQIPQILRAAPLS